MLEIGTGSGYFTALLATPRAAGHVGRDRSRRSSSDAAARLARNGIANVRCEVGDGARGWGRELYDAIVLTGSTPLLPETLLRAAEAQRPRVRDRRRAPVMTARLVAWTAPGSRVTTDLFETVVAPLKNAAAPARFRF